MANEATAQDQTDCTDKIVFKGEPTKEQIDKFENKKFRQRQMDLVRLRKLEERVNLKALPAALVTVPVALAVVGLSLPEMLREWLWISPALSVFAAVALYILLRAIRRHNREEALLNCWTKAFEDSHARATKSEETDVAHEGLASTAVRGGVGTAGAAGHISEGQPIRAIAPAPRAATDLDIQAQEPAKVTSEGNPA